MMLRGQNPPLVVWISCFLWLMSLIAIAWSLLLFFSVGDILLLTGMDLVSALVLLSGILMLPTNVIILCAIANGKKIDCRAKVLCCPLWLSIVWIIIINGIGIVVCVIRSCSCDELVTQQIFEGMRRYRSDPRYKNFLDNLQWSLKCCGLNSYRDWFNKDWYDRIRDYEWDVSLEKNRNKIEKRNDYTDSVPLSCCKSGSCISNYLSELGTYSINTSGCGQLMSRIVMVSLNVHLIMFSIIVIAEIIMLRLLIPKDNVSEKSFFKRKFDVRRIMQVRDNFKESSGSFGYNPDEDSDNNLVAPSPLDNDKNKLLNYKNYFSTL